MKRSLHDLDSTRWSVVLAATGHDEDRDQALETLCRLYWFPLYSFVRRQNIDADRAEDLTQEFFAELLEKNRGASPSRGSKNTVISGVKRPGYERIQL